jgi:hypothetical protein
MHIGILTSGGDTPGLNAAIRGIGKAAINTHEMSVIGFRDGFKGLMQNRSIRLDRQALSGILTLGGTILGTSREKPHKMEVGGQKMDMTDAILENIEAPARPSRARPSRSSLRSFSRSSSEGRSSSATPTSPQARSTTSTCASTTRRTWVGSSRGPCSTRA